MIDVKMSPAKPLINLTASFSAIGAFADQRSVFSIVSASLNGSGCLNKSNAACVGVNFHSCHALEVPAKVFIESPSDLGHLSLPPGIELLFIL